MEPEKVIRYHTKNINKAFAFMDEKNKIVDTTKWHVAKHISTRIIFDVDNHDEKNVKQICEYYNLILLTNWIIHKTQSGYHIISEKKYNNCIEWQYDTCRVLYPLLLKERLQEYIEQIEKFMDIQYKKQHIDNIQKDDFLKLIESEFKKSKLYFGIGEFDMLFAINVILKGYYCIRISKKSPEEDFKPISL